MQIVIISLSDITGGRFGCLPRINGDVVRRKSLQNSSTVQKNVANFVNINHDKWFYVFVIQ